MDAAIVAAARHRVVARRAQLAAGVGEEAIRHRLDNDRLYRVHRGVYAIGTPDLDRLGHWLAAVLACGEGAMLSHRSAAALWGLLDAPAGPIEVTVPGGWSCRRPGIRVHAARSLLPTDLRHTWGIPCTGVERTLIDIAGGPAAELERAVEQAFVLHLLGRPG